MEQFNTDLHPSNVTVINSSGIFLSKSRDTYEYDNSLLNWFFVELALRLLLGGCWVSLGSGDPGGLWVVGEFSIPSTETVTYYLLFTYFLKRMAFFLTTPDYRSNLIVTI